MGSWTTSSEDILDQLHLVHLSQYPETLLDFLGLSYPSPEDQLIQLETLKETITMAKNSNTRNNAPLNADIDAAAELAAAAEGNLPVAGDSNDVPIGPYGPEELILPGTLMTIVIHDVAMKLDAYGLPATIRSLADNCQYTIESNKLRIEEMQMQAQERVDRESNAGNRPTVESTGDTIDTAIDYELKGLTDAQVAFMMSLEDGVERSEMMLNEMAVWYEAINGSNIPLLRRTNLEVRNGIIEARVKRAEKQKEAVAQRMMLATAKLSRMARAQARAEG